MRTRCVKAILLFTVEQTDSAFSSLSRRVSGLLFHFFAIDFSFWLMWQRQGKPRFLLLRKGWTRHIYLTCFGFFRMSCLQCCNSDSWHLGQVLCFLIEPEEVLGEIGIQGLFCGFLQALFSCTERGEARSLQRRGVESVSPVGVSELSSSNGARSRGGVVGETHRCSAKLRESQRSAS